MNQTELQNIKDLLNKTTSEPWVTDLINHKWIVSCGDPSNYHTIASINSNPGMNGENNAKFIAASRQIIQNLINEIEKLNRSI